MSVRYGISVLNTAKSPLDKPDKPCVSLNVKLISEASYSVSYSRSGTEIRIQIILLVSKISEKIVIRAKYLIVTLRGDDI